MTAAVTFEVVQDVPVDDVVELYKAGGWWREDPGWRASIPAMVRGSFCFMVAREGSAIVGMARAISDGVSDAYIQDVVVLSSHRGRGLGAQLVKQVAEFCAGKGVGWVGLVAEPGTRAFYERLGFGPLPGYQPMLYGKRDPA